METLEIAFSQKFLLSVKSFSNLKKADAGNPCAARVSGMF